MPVGYVLNSALYRSAEIAYNVFETWRGAEAGAIYGRVLATVRHLFGADSFTIYPYQLGEGNREALESGAWWFYQKMGFRPRDREVRRRMGEEQRRMRIRPSHRSSIATLKRLAGANLYYHLGRRREDVIGLLPLWRDGTPRWWAVGLAIVILVLALVWPRALAPANRIWLRIGLLLHRIVNPIVMGVIFYLVVTPFGYVMRLSRKGFIDSLRPDKDAPTYWIQRNDVSSPMNQQF